MTDSGFTFRRIKSKYKFKKKKNKNDQRKRLNRKVFDTKQNIAFFKCFPSFPHKFSNWQAKIKYYLGSDFQN